MNCRECMENLDLYIDGALCKAEEKAFEIHIAECESCRAEYETLKGIIDSLQSIEEEPLPEGFDEKLRENLRQIDMTAAQTTMKNGVGKFRWIAYVAASLIVLAGSYAIFENVSMPNKAGQQLSMNAEDLNENTHEVSGAKEQSVADEIEEGDIGSDQNETHLTKADEKQAANSYLNDAKENESVQQSDATATEQEPESDTAQQPIIAMSNLDADANTESLESNAENGAAYDKFEARSLEVPNVIYIDGEAADSSIIIVGMGDVLKIRLSGSDWEYSVQGDVIEPVGAETNGEKLEITFVPIKEGEGSIMLAKKSSQPIYTKELKIAVE